MKCLLFFVSAIVLLVCSPLGSAEVAPPVPNAPLPPQHAPGANPAVTGFQCESETAEKTDIYKKELAKCNTDHTSCRTEILQHTTAYKEAQQKIVAMESKTVELQNEVTRLKKNTEKASQAEVLQTKVADLEKAQGSLKTKSDELSAQVEKMKAAEATAKAAETAAKADLQKAKDAEYSAREALRSQKSGLESCSTERQTLQRKMTEVTEKDAQEIRRLEAALKGAMKDNAALQKELVARSQHVYSYEQFRGQASSLLTIFKAGYNAVASRVVEVVGPDNVSLIKLQSAVWLRNAQNKLDDSTANARHRTHALYRKHAGTYHDMAMLHGRKLVATGRVHARTLGTHAQEFTKTRMQRLIDSFSAQDPSVRALFPENFTDRAFAFAFVFGAFYAISSAIEWLFTALVVTPISSLIGCGGKGNKKGAKKSSTRKTSVNPTGTKSAKSAELPAGGKVTAGAKAMGVKAPAAKTTQMR